MLRRFFAPIHLDGLKFVGVGALATLLFFLLWAPAGWAAGFVTLWMAYFFRDPWRVTPIREGLLISPADGIVVSIGPATPPPELVMGDEAVVRIGIFLNIFDVHVTRGPVGGRVAAMRYTKGRFVNASLDKASEDNERLAIRIAPPDGPDVAFVLIAGLVARRIVCNVQEGQSVCRGDRFGIIRFGSRVDVYLTETARVTVTAGQTVRAGETVLAEFRN